MKILFCSEPFNPKSVDAEYEQEYYCALTLGLDVYLVSLEELLEGEPAKAIKRVPAFETPELFIYRGWMLKPKDYEALHLALRQKNAMLINSPAQYINGHYFPFSYEAIKAATPESIWLGMENLQDGLDPLYEKMNAFGDRPVIVKDYVKSRKHEWVEACFIPEASDRQQAQTVLRNFIDRQGSELNGGVVIRKFIQLEQLGNHPKSGMPLSNEYRLFFLDHELVQCIEYWDEAAYRQETPMLDTFIALAKGVASRFFTMDIAKTASGTWTVIELGDGQVSGLPSHANLERFYKSILSKESTITE
ncbi:ATP-grasp domain-containing protein [Paenibacillus sp. NFR01]|uniref:ATP-grasp domain-containing protein n=1 Tax=Paenibacillus sp. NFR01 TaxID=1566279 RepID=UPI0008CDB22F|nr:ATP-grasp domain-containing protein [Paenibacillus sp. NFR01]SEU27927.1 hypothetical protein SAMN03159358_4638 [Paenibacillus sp. NFR01]